MLRLTSSRATAFTPSQQPAACRPRPRSADSSRSRWLGCAPALTRPDLLRPRPAAIAVVGGSTVSRFATPAEMAALGRQPMTSSTTPTIDQTMGQAKQGLLRRASWLAAALEAFACRLARRSRVSRTTAQPPSSKSILGAGFGDRLGVFRGGSGLVKEGVRRGEEPTELQGKRANERRSHIT
jgi:hypothetical protein